MKRTYLSWAGAVALALAPSCGLPGPSSAPTPLELARYQRQTSSDEISAFLAALGRRYRTAEHLLLGRSAGGRSLDILLVSRDVNGLIRGEASTPRLRILIIGSQHGTESSGAEAILLVAREALAGSLAPWLGEMDLILMPNANPDGRESRRRTNADRVNISTDFVLLSQPESRAIFNALVRWQPSLLLDVHESAILKRQSLALQGYLTDFEAQFEIANNPNVDSGLALLSRDRLLPEMMARLEAAGLGAQSYIGEITDIRQPITHGGLSLRNLRNRAGMAGTLAFLVENRLDRADAEYPTPRNIQVRTAKQYLSIIAFLATSRAHWQDILKATARAREVWRSGGGEPPVLLESTYTADPDRPQISLGLRRIDSGKVEMLGFEYNGAVLNRYPLPVPAAYVVTDHQGTIGQLLQRQHVTYRTVARPERHRVTVQRVTLDGSFSSPQKSGSQSVAVRERQGGIEIQPGALWIDLRQPAHRLIPLLLDPRSNSSIFGSTDFSSLLVPGEDFFIYRLDGR